MGTESNVSAEAVGQSQCSVLTVMYCFHCGHFVGSALGTAIGQGQYSLCDVVLFSLWSLHGHRIKCFSRSSGPKSVLSTHCDVVLFSLWSLCGLCIKCLGTEMGQGQYSLGDVVLFSLWSLHGCRIKCFSSCSGPRSVLSTHCVMLYCFHCGHFMGTESSVSAEAVGQGQFSVLTV